MLAAHAPPQGAFAVINLLGPRQTHTPRYWRTTMTFVQLSFEFLTDGVPVTLASTHISFCTRCRRPMSARTLSHIAHGRSHSHAHAHTHALSHAPPLIRQRCTHICSRVAMLRQPHAAVDGVNVRARDTSLPDSRAAADVANTARAQSTWTREPTQLGVSAYAPTSPRAAWSFPRTPPSASSPHVPISKRSM
jgi:hypothetical protein